MRDEGRAGQSGPSLIPHDLSFGGFMAEPARLYRSSGGVWSEGARWSSDVEPEESVPVAREDAISVQRVLAELPPRYRSALLLREYQDLSYEQMAAALRTSVGGVKSLLYRAREAFRGAYQRMAQEEGWLDQPALGGAVDAL